MKKWMIASTAAVALVIGGTAVWFATQGGQEVQIHEANSGVTSPLDLVLQQDEGFTCTDGDGDGFADQFPLLRCENGTVVCTDANGDGLDDTYTGLRCPQSGGSAGSPSGVSGQDSTAGQGNKNQNDNEQAEPEDQGEDQQGENEQDEQNQQGDQNGDQQDAADAAACDPGVTHPVGSRLATQYGVSYETIMGYFCGQPHYGFGQIKHAYAVAEITGISVDEVFALRESGLGWGQIKQQYGLIGGGHGNGNGPIPKDDTRNGNGNGNGNGHGHGYGHDKHQNEDDNGD